MRTTLHSIQKLLNSARDAINKKHFTEAESLLNRARDIDPLNPDVLHSLGIAAFSSGNINKAIEHFRAAAEQKKDDLQILFNYASSLMEINYFADALKQFNTILSHDPNHIRSLVKCSIILAKIGQFALAEKTCRMILKLDSNNPETFTNLGNLYKDQGKIEVALTYYNKALALRPDEEAAASSILFCLNYSNHEPESVFEEHKKWEHRFPDVKKSATKKDRAPLPHPKNTRIHIGYVSADFRKHPVGFFIEPVIAHHNKKTFKIFCYANLSISDTITERIKEKASVWRSIYNLNDEDAAAMIRDDKIDILVDLSGHSGDNRLLLFLRKPAPIQVTYLGYPNTTGLSTMDYRITDIYSDPDGYDRLYTEKLCRLPGGFLCYRPPDSKPPVAEAPVLKNSYITFGSFNNLPKVNDDTITQWVKILNAVPDSRLIIKSKLLSDDTTRERFQDMFLQRGIPRDRLILRGHIFSIEEHLAQYNRVDIALDTFPYNGTTTTCEALLMGVPVITLTGNCHASRVGNSILSQVSCSQMTTQNKGEYIETASALAGDIPRLVKIRTELRSRLLGSSLCDGAAFVQKLENCYTEMITRYRESKR